VELHPKWWAMPAQTPQIHRSLFARLTPIPTSRRPFDKAAIQQAILSLTEPFL
jgi:hypothetical protein